MAPDNIHERRAYVAKMLDERGTIDDYRAIAELFDCSVTTIRSDIHYIASTRNGSTIYGLRDPETGLIRYVGQTDGNPRYRYHKHMTLMKYGREKNKAKAEWIADLASKGKAPRLAILEQCPFSQLNEREQWWIKHLISEGVELVNVIGNPTAAARENGKRGGRPRKAE